MGAVDGIYFLTKQENCWQIQQVVKLPQVWLFEPAGEKFYVVVENPQYLDQAQIFRWQDGKEPEPFADIPEEPRAIAVNPDMTSPDKLFISSSNYFWIASDDGAPQQFEQIPGEVVDLLAFFDGTQQKTRLLQAHQSGLFEFDGLIR